MSNAALILRQQQQCKQTMCKQRCWQMVNFNCIKLSKVDKASVNKPI